jgi:diguanylate cyclase (GGDEF)-like protein
VILLSEIAHPRDAVLIGRKILIALGAPYYLDARELRLTASLGIVCYPDNGEDATTLMKNADIAMYDAKGGGGNNYRSFQAPTNVYIARRQSGG